MKKFIGIFVVALVAISAYANNANAQLFRYGSCSSCNGQAAQSALPYGIENAVATTTSVATRTAQKAVETAVDVVGAVTSPVTSPCKGAKCQIARNCNGTQCDEYVPTAQPCGQVGSNCRVRFRSTCPCNGDTVEACGAVEACDPVEVTPCTPCGQVGCGQVGACGARVWRPFAWLFGGRCCR